MRGSGYLREHIRSYGYEIAYCYMDFISNGELFPFVTLYSKEIDVSKIVHRFEGGGHAGAEGFHFKR
jgi:nanoRNase/pAp phosphatase (c-di-AMP/oligoRNAs hydrolase)